MFTEMFKKFRDKMFFMNGMFILVTLLSVISLTCRQACGQQQISQFGITWTFDRDCITGQFANGDYWIVGPVTIIGINPPSVTVDGRVINGSMVNPSPKLGPKQGYDSVLYGRYTREEYYNPTLNAARPNGMDLSADNALVLQPGSSLISTISTPQADGRTQLQAASVLTVLDSPAPEGSFRPPYCGADKTIKYNKNQLDYSILASLQPAAGMPGLATAERYFERPWLDHIPGWLGSCHHPVENMPSYGREIATNIGVGALMLHLNFTNTEKETLLIRYVQLGVDLYGIVQDGGRSNWVNNGGHAGGRKWPIMFAGLVLNDPNMKNIGQKSGDYLYSEGYGPGNEPSDYIHFGEDDQTFYVTQTDVEMTHGSQWNPDSRDAQRIRYEHDDINLPEWGIVHAIAPYTCNKFWYTSYRQVSSPCWGGFILAAHIMGVKDLWNHDALFDYEDRYMQVEMTWKQTSVFVQNMWDEYRSVYGRVWTMNPVLNIDSIGGTVTRYPDKTFYDLGERVALSAVADPGYEFTGWSGGVTGDETPAELYMYANHCVSANFVEKKSNEKAD